MDAFDTAPVPCSACGGPLDPADAIVFQGHSFHDACYTAERFADPDALLDEAAEVSGDLPSAVMEAIAARGMDVVAYL